MRALLLSLATLVAAAVAVPAQAQEATRISQHQAWGTYATQQGGGRVCYVLSVPTEMQPTSLDHGNIYFFISQKPGQTVTYEPQFIAAYNFQDNSKVQISVGDRSFTMFTRGNLAWLETPSEEPALVAAMRSGTDMRVQATSGRGNPTSYVFSLRGVTAALESINTCG
jgi:hypothetical protein